MRSRLSFIFADSRARWFLATMLVFGVAGGMFGGVMNNYLYESLHIGKAQRGMIELPREMPGLLVVGMVALLHGVPELRILRLALICCLAGMVGLSLAGDSRVAAIAMIVMWSTGEHLMMPVSPSIAMHMAKPGQQGLAMGAVGSVTSIGQVAGYYLVPLLFVVLLRGGSGSAVFGRFQLTFVGAATVMAAAIVLSTRFRSGGEVRRQRLLFRRIYWRFYILELLHGGRKQVFITFAPYVLIVVYGARTEVLSSLYGVCAVTNVFVGPALGRLVDRIGYRPVLIADAALLVGLCLVYGYSHVLFPGAVAFGIVCAAFILDSALFTVGLARNVYVKGLSSSAEEVTATLSAGVSINHLVSILIAVAGGMVWERTSVEALFGIAAGLAVGAFLFTLTLPSHCGTALESGTACG